jgi:TrmH family RNA methyltransferase
MITSFSNPLIKRIKRLRQRKHRLEEGVFFIEGLRVVLTAIEQQAPIETILYASALLTSETGRQVIERQQAQGVECVELDPAVFTSISERDNPTGVAAIVQMAWRELDSLPVEEQAIYVAVEDTADPGNLGTMLRTIDAAGAAGLIVVGQSTDPFHPTAVKASMGTLFTVPISRAADMGRVLTWARAHGLQTIATSAKAKQLYWGADYRFPVLLLMGSEREGLGREVLEAADSAVTIPMHGSASSLNVAVATSLLLYEFRRRVTPYSH